MPFNLYKARGVLSVDTLRVMIGLSLGEKSGGRGKLKFRKRSVVIGFHGQRLHFRLNGRPKVCEESSLFTLPKIPTPKNTPVYFMSNATASPRGVA